MRQTGHSTTAILSTLLLNILTLVCRYLKVQQHGIGSLQYRPCSVLARCVASSLYGMEKDRDRPGSAVDNPLFPVRNGS